MFGKSHILFIYIYVYTYTVQSDYNDYAYSLRSVIVINTYRVIALKGPSF